MHSNRVSGTKIDSSGQLDEVKGQVPQLLINHLRKQGLSRKTILNAPSTLSGVLQVEAAGKSARRVWIVTDTRVPGAVVSHCKHMLCFPELFVCQV